MAKLDDATVLKRAKELCEKDGKTWEDHRMIASAGRSLDDAGRREYRARAWEQLLEELNDA